MTISRRSFIASSSLAFPAWARARGLKIGVTDWNLRLTSGTDVMLPEGHEVAALDRLLLLQQQHELLDRPLAAIDMRLGDRLVLRPRVDEKKPT